MYLWGTVSENILHMICEQKNENIKENLSWQTKKKWEHNSEQFQKT